MLHKILLPVVKGLNVVLYRLNRILERMIIDE